MGRAGRDTLSKGKMDVPIGEESSGWVKLQQPKVVASQGVLHATKIARLIIEGEMLAWPSRVQAPTGLHPTITTCQQIAAAMLPPPSGKAPRPGEDSGISAGILLPYRRATKQSDQKRTKNKMAGNRDFGQSAYSGA
ncbi:hypothetical protein CPSG_02035 [Coccidioides posadasii str. Silveira]|uniref:Uncharacterized protein n=1 Tax=Coccidioides posadasii (strain RMSCC 757 / Silveira) TaxID=443226 RepID=E9CX52_COCPS|nr:hypothetical protein CPSG_02035 [Coccidioides posadasii str. Silveira]